MKSIPIIRKIYAAGRSSRGVILPKSWLEEAEQRAGCRIVAVALEINGSIILTPVFAKRAVEAH